MKRLRGSPAGKILLILAPIVASLTLGCVLGLLFLGSSAPTPAQADGPWYQGPSRCPWDMSVSIWSEPYPLIADQPAIFHVEACDGGAPADVPTSFASDIYAAFVYFGGYDGWPPLRPLLGDVRCLMPEPGAPSETLLFSITTNVYVYTTTLNTGVITDGLRSEFKDHGYDITETTTTTVGVNVVTPNEEWEIEATSTVDTTEQTIVYIVRLEDGVLNIYLSYPPGYPPGGIWCMGIQIPNHNCRTFDFAFDVAPDAAIDGFATKRLFSAIFSANPVEIAANLACGMVNDFADPTFLIAESYNGVGGADLRVTQGSTRSATVGVGEVFTYTIFVDNLGPSYAHNVVVTDTIVPTSSITIMGWLPSQGSCTVAGNLITCNLGDLPEPGRATIEIAVKANEPVTINSNVRVTSDTFDPNTDNNLWPPEGCLSCGGFIDVTAVSDLVVTMTEVGEVQVNGSPGGTVTLIANQVTAGRSLTYTLNITNTGPSDAENVVLQVSLPPWLVVTGATPSQGACDTGSPPLDKLTCSLGKLVSAPAAGSSARIIITATCRPGWLGAPSRGAGPWSPATSPTRITRTTL